MAARGERKITRERMKKIIDEFIAYCEENNLMPIDAGLAARLGVTTVTLWSWKKDEYFRDILEEFESRAEFMIANSERKNSQLVLKHKCGYRETTEIDLGERTVKEIEKISLAEKKKILGLYQNAD